MSETPEALVTIGVLFAAFVLFLACWLFSLVVNHRLKEKIRKLNNAKRSEATKRGLHMEQFAPFFKAFPYNKDRFRFLGSPIDGIVFEDNKIIFVEFKTGSAKLSKTQRKIRYLVRKVDPKREVMEFKILRF